MARTLRVLFDDALALNPAGTGTFTRGIQTPLSRLDGIELIPAGSAARPHQLDIVNKGILRRMRNGADRVWYYLDTLPRLAARNRCDVIYCPAALTALRGRVPAVMTVFDMTTRLFPHTLDPLSGIYARQMLRIGLRRSSTICTISQAVRAELLSRYPRLTPDRVQVAYPGPSPEMMQADPQPALPDDAPFLLMVGTLEPRKNHVTALRAFARYRQGPHDAGLRLVLAGSPGWRYQPVADEIERLGLQDAVVRLGPTTPGRLKWLYQHARALLFPSLYEGFGLPVLEAFALRCPVVAARIPPVMEVAQSTGALLLEPDSVPAWATAIERVSTQPPDAARLATAQQRARHFTWEACAGAVRDALRAAAT